MAEWKVSWRLPVVLGKATQGNKPRCFHDEALSRCLMNSSTKLRSPKDTVPLGSVMGCMFMCESEESDVEISNQNQCLQVFGVVAPMHRERKNRKSSIVIQFNTHGCYYSYTGHKNAP